MARTLTADHMRAIDAYVEIVRQCAVEFLAHGESPMEAREHAERTVRALLRENLLEKRKPPGHD